MCKICNISSLNLDIECHLYIGIVGHSYCMHWLQNKHTWNSSCLCSYLFYSFLLGICMGMVEPSASMVSKLPLPFQDNDSWSMVVFEFPYMCRNKSLQQGFEFQLEFISFFRQVLWGGLKINSHSVHFVGSRRWKHDEKWIYKSYLGLAFASCFLQAAFKSWF